MSAKIWERVDTTYLWVEEKRVGSPGERLCAAVEVGVVGLLRELAAVLVLEVLQVLGMGGLELVDVGNSDDG